MDDTWNEADLRYAEWFAWAKREVSGDERVCHGVASAALEALQRGAGREEIEKIARASVLGRVAVLADEASPGRRAYAEWYDWARRELKGEPERLHTATQVALRSVRDGGDAVMAARAASDAIGPSEQDAPEEPGPATGIPDFGPGQAPPPPPGSPRDFYAGFGLRVASFLIDGAATMAFLLVAGFVIFAFYVVGQGQSLVAIWAYILVFWLVVTWLYRAGTESSGLQATIGKRIMGLAVINTNGGRPSFGRATLRFAGELLSLLTLGIGFLVALFNPERKALHDLIAGTAVVRREYASVAPAVIAHLASPRTQPVPPPRLEFRP